MFRPSMESVQVFFGLTVIFVADKVAPKKLKCHVSYLLTGAIERVPKYFFYLTLISIRFFQQHCCYNMTGHHRNAKGLISQREFKKYIPNYNRFRLRCVHSQLLT